MPHSAQYLYDNKNVFDFFDEKQIVNLHQILLAKEFPGNIQLLEKDGKVKPLNECTLDQIKAFKIALIKKAHSENLHPLFIGYITDIFKLYDVKEAITAKNDLSRSLAQECQELTDEVNIKSNELKILQNNNGTRIQEIEKKYAELKAENKKYQFGKNALMIFTMLAFSVAAVVSPLPVVLTLIGLGISGLVGEIILEKKANESNNDMFDTYSESYKLKQPIVKLERDLKYKNKILSEFSEENTACQNELQKLKEEQLALEENVSNFNPNQLDSAKILMPALHTEGMFKVDNTKTKLAPSTEIDMHMDNALNC
ncbi:hypothetical protein Lsan_3433 [Legionella santicrucis]|uniref:Uncharacterized protein n=1 Tax=Legionella santicrucis TaxID=45074 RepID=A0A0W0YFZ7_9GAMM|nr:hypothetical protein [Legionella santicrucis]KTD55881.1 hypothetical protein Lsan_3433 [Legionella santicrucis]